jgi:predicted dehydrogenase
VIGAAHAKGAAGDNSIQLTALADLDRQRVEELAAAHDVPKVYGDAEALIADAEIDAVVLALPTGVRLAVAVEALQAGKHVLLEKPGAMNVAEVEQLIAARGDRTVGVASCRFQFLPFAEAVRQAIREGAIGKLRIIRIRGGTPCEGQPNRVPWRLKRSANGGGLLVNWGTYDLDYALSRLDWTLNPTTILARTWNIAPPLAELVHPEADAETHVIAQIHSDADCVIELDRGEFLPVVEDEVQFIGETGAIRHPFRAAGGMKVLIDRIRADGPRETETLWEGDADWEMLHAGPVRDFAAAIRERRRPATDLERWMILQQIFDAAYRSAATGSSETIGVR